jgi:hypothetical protein
MGKLLISYPARVLANDRSRTPKVPSTGGFVASYEFDRPTRTSVILLANTSYGRANYKPLVRRILLLHPGSPGGTGLVPTAEH